MPEYTYHIHSLPLRREGKTRLSSVAGLFLLCFLAITQTTSAQNSMYADPKANNRGDILTIILAERTDAQRESGWENKSDARVGGTGSVSGTDLEGRFGVDANFNKEALNSNGSIQRDLLQGTISALVIALDSTGNLVVQGERKLHVNGETHIMRVSGVVRPFDVRYDNSILSYQIANANIDYRRAGFGRRFFKPGVLARAGILAILGAATYAALK